MGFKGRGCSRPPTSRYSAVLQIEEISNRSAVDRFKKADGKFPSKVSISFSHRVTHTHTRARGEFHRGRRLFPRAIKFRSRSRKYSNTFINTSCEMFWNFMRDWNKCRYKLYLITRIYFAEQLFMSNIYCMNSYICDKYKKFGKMRTIQVRWRWHLIRKIKFLKNGSFIFNYLNRNNIRKNCTTSVRIFSWINDSTTRRLARSSCEIRPRKHSRLQPVRVHGECKVRANVTGVFDLLYAARSRDRCAPYRVFEFYLTAYSPATMKRRYENTFLLFHDRPMFTSVSDNGVYDSTWNWTGSMAWLF